jgi:hypothetical protein
MVRRNDDTAALRDIFGVCPTHPPQEAGENSDNWPENLQGPLRQHRRVRPRAVGTLGTIESCGAFAQNAFGQSIGCESIATQQQFIAPGFWQLNRVGRVIIPTFTLRAIEATVLNRLRLRQTNKVPPTAIGKRTIALDFNEQCLAGKMKTRSLSHKASGITEVLKTVP